MVLALGTRSCALRGGGILGFQDGGEVSEKLCTSPRRGNHIVTRLAPLYTRNWVSFMVPPASGTVPFTWMPLNAHLCSSVDWQCWGDKWCVARARAGISGSLRRTSGFRR